MKNLMSILIAALFVVCGWQYSAAQGWEYPVIKDYGPVYPMPGAAVQPDKSLEYKIVFDITQKAAKDSDINPGLDHVARFINVFASAGIMPDKMKLVLIIHGPATGIALNNNMYVQQYGTDNPNIELLSALKKNGVILYVCGQSMADSDFQKDWIDPDITVALSSLTVLSTYQLKGYALMPW
jgi:intracellular sulfur oxidation DsrE/DsrF family protein